MSKLKPPYKTGKGKSQLPRDPGARHVPGFLGRSKTRTIQAREYTNENRLSPGGRGRVISLPKAQG